VNDVDVILAIDYDGAKDESWMILAAAVTIAVGVKSGMALWKYLATLSAPTLAQIIATAERVGSATKPDAYHRAASFLSQAQLAAGQLYTLTGGDGAAYSLFQVAGDLNGKTGTYEYIINEAGQITHQMFVINGVVNGILQGVR
jgi:hypothetical protein